MFNFYINIHLGHELLVTVYYWIKNKRNEAISIIYY